MRRLLLVGLALGLAMPSAQAMRSKKPQTFSNLQDTNQLTELNQTLEDFWNITNGRYTLENITTDPDGSRPGLAGDLIYAVFGGLNHLCINTSARADTTPTDWTCINIGTLSTCPGGADGMVQFNDNGTCGGDAQFLWEKNLNILTVTGSAGFGSVTTPGATVEIDPANTTNATVEDIEFLASSQTIAVNSGSTITSQRQNQFLAPTINGVAGGAAETVTDAATVYIDAAPSGSNITISNTSDLLFGATSTEEVHIDVQDQTASNTNGRALEIFSANGNGNGEGGYLTISAGAGGTSNGGGGDLILEAGDGNGTGVPGFIDINAGNSGASYSLGGGIDVRAGAGLDQGGYVILIPGANATTGLPGIVQIQGAAGTVSNGTTTWFNTDFDQFSWSIESGGTATRLTSVGIQNPNFNGVAGGAAETCVDCSTLRVDGPPAGSATYSSGPYAIYIYASTEGADANIALEADQGDDVNDTWVLVSEAADNDLSLVNGTTEVAKVSSNGSLSLDTDIFVSRIAEVTGQIVTWNTITSNRTSDFGWSVQTGANTACTSTCTTAAVFGQDTDTANGPIVGPSDATADRCVCAGSN